LAGALLIVLAGAVAQPALADVANGGFESPTVSGSVTYSAPATLGGWAVEAGAITQADASVWAPASGAQSIAMANGGARLSQSVPVVAGRRYRLSFAYADGTVPPGVGYISCGSIGGKVMPVVLSWQGKTVGVVHWSGGHLTDDWQHFSTLVTASASTARVQLSSEPPTEIQDCGMNLDDVVLGTPSANETAVTLASAANPSVSGQPVSVTATVISGDVDTVPAGKVQFAVDGAPAGAPVALDAGGQAVLGPTAMKAGDHVVTGVYQPAGGTSFQRSEALPLTQRVDKAATATELAITPDPTVAGQDATFTAVVRTLAPGSGNATGTVQFRESDGRPIGDPLPLTAGKATLVASAEAGVYVVRADYSGDAELNASSISARQTVDRADTTTEIASSANPVAAGSRLTFTIEVATVSPGYVQPAGTVVILVNGQDVSGPIPLFDDGPTAAGVDVTFTVPTTPRSDMIGAVYQGDSNTSGSSSPTFVQTVTAAAAPTGQSPPPTVSPTIPTPPAGALTAMTAPLVRTLKRRGLTALDGAKEALTAAGPGTLTQRVYTPVEPGSAKRRSVLIASGTRVYAGAGKGTLTLRLTAAGRRASRRAKRIKLVIVTRFAPATGAPVVAIRRLTVGPRAAATGAGGRRTGGRIRVASPMDPR
jgi:hypothetical protein